MKRIPLLYIAAFFVVAISALSTTVYMLDLQTSRQRLLDDTSQRNVQRALQLSESVRLQMTSLFEGFDLATRELRAAYLRGPETFEASVRDVVATYPDGAIKLILVFDAKGYLSYSSDGSTEKMYFGDREHFLVHSQSGQDHLFISKPVFGRLGKTWVSLFTRPIFRDGKFDGVIVLSLRPDFLARNLANINVNPGDVVTLFRAEGDYLARTQKQDEAMGTSAFPDRPFLQAAPGAHGWYRADSKLDGTPRVYGWQRLSEFPLVVTVGMDEAAVLAVVNQELDAAAQRATLAVAAIMLFSLGIAGLLVWVERQQRSLVRSQHQAAEQADRFQMLLRNASDGIHILDAQGGLVVASDSFYRMLGRTADQAEGLNVVDWDACFPKDELVKRIAEYGREAQMFETRHRRRDGSVFDVEINACGIVLDGHDYLFASARDITERKLAEAERHRAEAALRATSARLKLVLETAAEGIIGIDDTGKVTFANPSAAQILGWGNAEAMLGKPRVEVLGHCLESGAPCTGNVCPITQTLLDGQVRRVANESFTGADGALRPVEYVVSPLWADAAIVGVTVAFHDVSEHIKAAKEIRELLAFRRAVVDAAGHAVLASDADGTLVLFNPAAERLLGYKAEEVVGKLTSAVFFDPDELRAKVGELTGGPVEGEPIMAMRVLLANRQTPLDCEFNLLRQDGSSVPVLLALTALRDDGGRLQGVIGIGQDISAVKEMEAELKRSNAELERFAYVASHDLRQPLRMVASYVTLLSRSLAGRLDESEQEFIGFAVDGAKRMDRMIIDLLDYSRIGRVGAPMEPVALGTAVARAVSNLGPMIEESGAEVTVQLDLPTVTGSDSELERLFQNLIGNAVKFHAEGRVPKVAVTWRQTPRQVVLAVADNGIGIDPKDYDRLFHVFQRLVSQGDYEGTGIGLAACRKIVEHHGGKIWINSAVDQGSTFYIALPRVEQKAGIPQISHT